MDANTNRVNKITNFFKPLSSTSVNKTIDSLLETIDNDESQD
jgi:hypothetical protein